MSPLLDQVLVALLIGGALAYLGVCWRRRSRTGKGCGSGCGTAAKPLAKDR